MQFPLTTHQKLFLKFVFHNSFQKLAPPHLTQLANKGIKKIIFSIYVKEIILSLSYKNTFIDAVASLHIHIYIFITK